MDSYTERWLHNALHNRIAVNEKDGSLLVYVPAGEFEMGDGRGSDCPPHRVTLSAYWIGVYCVTNAQYRKFVDATGHRAADDSSYREPELADHPAVNVSWDDAQAYAQWAGCELPTEAQWEKAARGPQGLIYPWGKDWDAGKCRHGKNTGNETTAPVYGYPGGVSGYGTYNQSGNVWEWCADWYDKDYYRQSPGRDPRGPDGGSDRAYRGGSWRAGFPRNYRAADRGRHDPAPATTIRVCVS
jgi:formylglycine-generating enzyme required for sulfatase activity